MTFAQPLWFAALAVLLPSIIALHALRRHEHSTGSLFLWNQVPDRRSGGRRRRNVPWQSPLLWLHLAIVTIAILALAGPALGPGGNPTHVVVLLDGSRTMQITDVAPNRFGVATQWLGDTYGTPRESVDVSLILVGAEANLATVRHPPGASFRNLVMTLEPSDGAPAWGEAILAADRLLEGDPSGRITILSDPASSSTLDRILDEPYGVQAAGVDRYELGGPYVNVGLTEVSIAPRSGAEHRWTVTGSVTSEGLSRGDTVRIELAYRPYDLASALPWTGVEVVVDGRGHATFEVPLDLPGEGLVEVRTRGGDQDPSDDVIRFALQPARAQAHIALVGEQHPAVLAALRALGDSATILAFETAPEPDVARLFDLMVFGAADVPETPPATSVMWIGHPPDSLMRDGPVVQGVLSPASSAHPLTRDATVGEVAVTAARAVNVPSGADPLFRIGDAPVAWSRTTDTGRQVALGFELTATSWPAQLGFPVFVASLVEWSRSVPIGAAQACFVGEACSLPREAYAGAWTLVNETGDTVAEAPPLRTATDAMAEATWPAGAFERAFLPAHAGFYALRLASGATHWIAVNPAPPATPAVPAPTTESRSTLPTPDAVTIPLWRVLASLALLLLLVDAFLLLRATWRGDRARRAQRGRTALAPVTALVLSGVAATLASIPVPSPRFSYAGTQWILLDSVTDSTVTVRQRIGAGLRGWRIVEVPAREPRTSSETAPPAAPTSVEDVVEKALASYPSADAVDVAFPGAFGDDLSLATAWTVMDAASARAITVRTLASQEGHGEARGTPPGNPEGGHIVRAWVDGSPRVGEGFEIVVHVVPAMEPRELQLRDDDGAVLATTNLPAGTNRTTIEAQAGQEGPSRYEVILTTPTTENPEAQTSASLIVNVQAPLRLLHVTSADEDGNLARALEAQQIERTRVVPERVPATLERLLAYDVVLLDDVSASALHPFHQNMITEFVRDEGRGLVITGGTNAYGPGGYFATLLEDVSPLSARIEQDAPEISMTFVIDRSGSMNAVEGTATRMDLAKLATFEAIRLLGERSQAALIVFDAVATTLLPLRSTADLVPFRDALNSVAAAGGTSIYPALVQAYDVVADSDAATRHVIVMTDGLSEEGDFEEILARIGNLGIDTSFVGIGDTASRGQLTRLAGYGGGSLHFTSDARALPGILAQEALMLSANPIEEAVTQAAWTSAAAQASLPGGEGIALPELLGYIRTTAKDEASTLVSDDDSGDPLLATWRYGLGRVAAFASEADGPWSAAWADLEGYAAFWSGLARWSAQTVPSTPWRLDVAVRQRSVDVRLDVRPGWNRDERPRIELVAQPEGTVLDRRIMDRNGMDRYGVRLGLPAPDGRSYQLRITGWNEDPAPIAYSFIHEPSGFSEERVIASLPLDALRTTEASAVAHTATGALRFLGPRVRGDASPRYWLVPAAIVFLVSVAMRFGAVSLPSVRRSPRP